MAALVPQGSAKERAVTLDERRGVQPDVVEGSSPDFEPAIFSVPRDLGVVLAQPIRRLPFFAVRALTIAPLG